MAEVVIEAKPANAQVNSGVLLSGVPYLVDLREDSRTVHLYPAESVTITSPRNAAATHANVAVRINGQQRTFTIIQGGATRTEYGPIFSVEVTPDANVAGTGTDNIFIQLNGSLKL